ncbi:protein TONSOKU isoform X4 [Salvia hispanica]|uniref:protein TONSOKU isoform X4 n=1 Tax=Salvia hispanica TaxID=49212 RepID=UPI002009C397|nr:protein TONSOKU isoform X4 [Salvia hispanica]
MRRKEESSQQQQLIVAKRAYKAAEAEGNRQEEARWANFIGDLHKNRGEYVEALRWLRKDYEVSIRYLPHKQLLATCQSLGELHLRLGDYEEALKFQKKHFDLAKDEDDLIEQQRASTQLGRTYHEMFLKSDDDHLSIRNAKKYFELSMELAQTIKKKSNSEKVSFVKEYIDAHNNLGMLEIDLDNLNAAEKILTEGLEICQEEEVPEGDATRSRLHHNLGNVYMELRKWEKARDHIKKDIVICKRIGHCQGEAKGYINHGELHYRNQSYEEALASYKKALELARTLEDEVALTEQIHQNITTVREAMRVMSEIRTEELNLKKLERNTEMARGTESERKFLLKQNSSLDCLVEKSRMIFAWLKGQALAKINIGDVLDCTGDYSGALDACREGYRIAVKGNLSSLQLSALENMHYSHMIRFDDADEARSAKILIDKLKQSKDAEIHPGGSPGDFCSETQTELDNLSADDGSDGSFSPKEHKANAHEVKSYDTCDESEEDITLMSLLRSTKGKRKKKPTCGSTPVASSIPCGSPARSLSRSSGSLTVNRKRVRIILSDDEGENDDNIRSDRISSRCFVEGIATSDELNKKDAPSLQVQDVSPVASRCTVDESIPANLQHSTSSHKSNGSKSNHANDSRITGSCADVGDSKTHRNINSFSIGSSNLLQNEISKGRHVCSDESCQHILFKIDQELVYMDPNMYLIDGKLNIEQMKVDLACFYYLQLSQEKRSRAGLVPVIQHMQCGEKILGSMETLYNFNNLAPEKICVEVSVGVMVPKIVMKLYIDCCELLSEQPNLEVLRRLYNLEVSEDEILVSDCQLRDVSVAPLLNALQMHKTLAGLDLSHNLLGNLTVENLRQVFMSSGQNYGGLILNLHNNCLGPAALFQICECHVLYARLEVLNVSGNPLTDACASYISTILRNCKALYSLNIENCSVTSRTIQKVAESLDSESALTHLFIGHNHPVSGNAVINLLKKLSATNWFQVLSLNGIKLSKPVVDSLCQLAMDCCLSGLLLGHTNIGTEGALQLIKPLSKDTQELVRLDLSNCALTCDYIVGLKDEASLVCGILELNLGGNPIMKEGSNELSSLLRNPQSCLRVLVVCKCELGLEGVIHMLQALSENRTLEELNLADNINPNEAEALTINCRPSEKGYNSSPAAKTDPDPLNVASPELVDALPQDMSALDPSENQLEVADSEDGLEEPRATSSGPGESSKHASPNMILHQESWPMQQLSSSVKMARSLKVLDLSGNGFSQEVSDALFSAWSSGTRAGLSQRHVDGKTVHYSVQGSTCCGIKPCCRKI